ncbi:HepT-like ribonuclease domain-containing protein [Pontibacter pamirensis]|uniref:HepT-like ribonuclease domain-containing protein n=1 Tax=Pontibacter pamirensis TaxID=2562824 RepID=UPI001F2421EF|nr:HepT-like ribonuclease domain-containing protein [Pontibacter pamirensis]
MDEELKVWLYDMLQSINEIEGYFEDRPKELEAYRKDTRTKRAVERNLEIIGEAANRILKASPGFPLPDAKQIISTRNRIIHGYDTVSDDLIGPSL